MATRQRLPRYLADVLPRRGFIWVLPRTAERVEQVERYLRERRARGWRFDHVTAGEVCSFMERNSSEAVVWEAEYRLDALASFYWEFMAGAPGCGTPFRPLRYRERFTPNRYDVLLFVPVSNGRYPVPVMAWVINRYA